VKNLRLTPLDPKNLRIKTSALNFVFSLFLSLQKNILSATTCCFKKLLLQERSSKKYTYCGPYDKNPTTTF
ncbi:unnamed protein product, partial [Amoebophrya sp. A120]